MSFNSSFIVISVVVHEPKFFMYPASAAAVNSYGIKALSGTGSSAFFINGKPVSNSSAET